MIVVTKTKIWYRYSNKKTHKLLKFKRIDRIIE